ncbi:smoothelin [Gastrophryne carolinensis]
MSGERFSAMDEGSLRKLLEVTLDLAERREIRSAIRELRRKELERCEEALASKRFRSERGVGQEDKENQPGADQEEKQQRALHALAGRLQEINDVEELTALLRGSSEYEERKLIRTAIRKIRNDEIEAAAVSGMLVSRCADRDNGTMQTKSLEGIVDLAPHLAQEKEDLEERKIIKAQIHELRTNQNGSSHIAVDDSPSDMVVLLHAPPRETLSSSSSSSSEPVQAVESLTTEQSPPSTDSEQDAPQNRSNEAFLEPTTHISNTERKKPLESTCSHQRAILPEEEKPPPNETSKTVNVSNKITTSNYLPLQAFYNVYLQSADTKGSLPEEKESRTCTEPDGKVPLSPFRRANSVRDRVKKFTEEPQGMPPPFTNRFSSMRGERLPARGGPSQQQQTIFSLARRNGVDNSQAAQEPTTTTKPPFSRSVSGQKTNANVANCYRTQDSKSTTLPEFPSTRGSSIKGSSSHSSAGPCTFSGEVSRRLGQSKGSFIPKQEGGRSNTDQLQGSQTTSKAGRQVENTDGNILNSVIQDEVQHSTSASCASSQDAQSDKQDDSMKTLLTIEIKDGRSQTTSSRILGQQAAQRSELALGLSPSPFRIGSGANTASDIRTSTFSLGSGANTNSSSAIKSLSTSNVNVTSQINTSSFTTSSDRLGKPISVNREVIMNSERSKFFDHESHAGQLALKYGRLQGQLLAWSQVIGIPLFMEENSMVATGPTMPSAGIQELDNQHTEPVQNGEHELRIFQKQISQQLRDMAMLLEPLTTTVNDLKEENLHLRMQQEKLERQVEELTRFLGVQGDCDSVPHPPKFASTRRSSSVHLSRSNSLVEADQLQQTSQQIDVFLPSPAVKVETEQKGKLSAEELRAIEDEDVLDKMLDKTTDFEERRLIRTAMRELRQRKREQREKERDQRLQEMKNKEREARLARSAETSVRQSEVINHGNAVSTITKTQRLVHSNDGSKTSRTTTVEASYVKRSENGGTVVQTKSSYSATSKKVGSVFDREDDGVAAMERRQAERKKELMKAQNLPKTPATQARKAMIEKLEKDSGSPGKPAFAKVATPKTAIMGVPNANSIKQMLLDWCKAKTRGYEHVNIQNFSSSWSDGMAFCALVHNFFPEAFDYNQLSPQNRRQNFDLAFSAAEKHADCPQLLDAEDMVRLREPDWKCVYTYIQEFYRCLVQKGMVKTKKS